MLTSNDADPERGEESGILGIGGSLYSPFTAKLTRGLFVYEISGHPNINNTMAKDARES